MEWSRSIRTRNNNTIYNSYRTSKRTSRRNRWTKIEKPITDAKHITAAGDVTYISRQKR